MAPHRTRCRRLVTLVCALTALLFSAAAPRVHAQTSEERTDEWARNGGTVEVSKETLTIPEGEFDTYSIRLTKPLPTDENENQVSGWWVMMRVAGTVWFDGSYDADSDDENDISWVPSVGWEFNPSDWPAGQEKSRWRQITIRALQDSDDQDARITFHHEVWDETAYCPDALHPRNLPTVTVHVVDDDDDDVDDDDDDVDDDDDDDDDDDGGTTPELSIGNAAPVREGGTAEFEVSLSPSSTETVTVEFQTADGTAEAGSDYTAQTGTLTFTAGQTTQTISVSTVDDGVEEETEAFTVTLRNPTGGATLDDATGTGTITDDDGVGGTTPELSIGDAAVEEGGTAEFEVSLSPSSTETVTVEFLTADGTAEAGSDYTASTGKLTFTAGQATQTISVSTVDDGVEEETEAFTVTLRNPTGGATLDDATGTGTITDDDDDDGGGTTPELSIGDAAVVEEGGTAEFEVSLSPSSTETVTVEFLTADGTAEAGSDYTASTGTLTFTAGQTTQTISVSTVDDGVEEETEAFTVTLRNPTGGATLDDATGTGTITDDDDDDGGGTTPELSIGDAAVVEEGGTAEFEVSLSPSSTETVTVEFQTADGTAEAGSDYTASTGTLTFTAGQTTQTISVSTVDDEVEEETEAFTVTLSNPTGGATLDDATGTGTITDDDGVGGTTPELSIGDAVVEEGGTAEFKVSLSPSSTETVTVEFQTADGTAEAGSDYTASTGTLTFTAGQATQTISVSTVDDEVEEETEAFTVTLSNPTGGAMLDDATGTGTITDDDDDDGGGTTPELSIGDAAVVEEGGTAEFEVSLSPSSTETVTVEFLTADGTAEAGSDYTAQTGTLTFTAGQTTQTISVSTVDDGVEEETEAFTVTLSNPTGGATLDDATGTGTITDDDGVGGTTPELSIGDAAVEEGGTAEFEVSLSPSSTETVTVEFLTADGTAEAGSDYMAQTGTLTFTAGQTTQTISVSTVDDGVAEETEAFTVTLRNPTGGATLEEATGTGTITDDDDDGGGTTPELSIGDAAVVEEGGTAEFEVSLSPSSTETVTVEFLTADGTAEAGSDYTASTGTLTFTAGQTTQTISVSTVDDGVEEETEAFTVTLSNPTGGATLDDATGTGTITDDDGVGGTTPELSIGDAAVEEGGTAEFEVSLSPSSTETVTVEFLTADGTAEAGSDYTASTGTLTFTAGQATQTISVSTVDDEVEEETEAFTVTLSNPTGGATLEDATGTGTITDDDGVGGTTPELSIGDAAVVEEGGTAEFEVSLSPSSTETVTVEFLTADGTAEAGSDYMAQTGTLTFTAGQTTRTISVSTVDDEVEEETEAFTVTLSNPTGGATLDDATGTGTITDDDGVGGTTPELSIGDAAVEEGGTAEFEVSLSPSSTETVTVEFLTADGTAEAGSDYTASTGKLTFTAGQATQTISVSTVDDGVEEETEAFTVTLSNPTGGATLDDATGTGTITDDDDDDDGDDDDGDDDDDDNDDDDAGGTTPALSIDDSAPVGEGGTAEFVVRLSAVSGVAVTVSYRTVDGTAVAGSDYTSTSGTLRFETGETAQTIMVAVLDDATAEAEEGFTVELSAPSGATVADGTGTGTITDDDELPELVIGDAPPVGEGETAEFVVGLSAPSGMAVTVSYRTADGTAVAGSDYTSTSGTLRFDPGTTTRTVGVAALIDELVEGAERFTVELSAPVGATVADGTGVGTITDDVERRIELVNRTVLPEIGRALAFTAVRCRIDQAFSGAASRAGTEKPAGHLSLSHALTSDGWTSPAREPLTLERTLGDSSFLMPSTREEGGTGRFAAWGCGDYRNLAGGGEDGAVAWDGEVFSVQLGADVRLGSDLLAGLSVSRSKGSFDYYARGTDAAAGGGGYELRLTGVHPYLGWSVSPDLDVWGTLGHAWGEIRIAEDLAGRPLTGAATLDSGAVGVRGLLLARGTTTLKLKGEGALARMDVAAAGAAFEAMAVDMRRLRLSTEASHEHVFSSGGSLTPWGELGVRHDGGDGQTGAGLEVGGGLRYQNPEAGWTTEGYGRWLAVHEGTLREWGFGGLIRFDPGASGRGPSVTLAPAWGDTASGVQRLWERGATEPTVPGAPGTRLDAQFGYGFAAFRGRGVLTPFGAVSLARQEGRGYRLGWRLAVGRSATASVEAERRERTVAPVAYAVIVRGAVRF